MKKWPTIIELSNACLEDVHKVWSGLGYYSRATRLLEGAKKIQETSQHLPQTAKELQQMLPGNLSGLSTNRQRLILLKISCINVYCHKKSF